MILDFLKVNNKGIKEFVNQIDNSIFIYIDQNTLEGRLDILFQSKKCENIFNQEQIDSKKTFYISKYPITNRQYRKYCDESNKKYPEMCFTEYFDDYFKDKPNFPVVNINFEDAKDYCIWSQSQIPTELQWLIASVEEKYINEEDRQLCTCGFSRNFPYESLHENELGIYDMTGSVYQWTCNNQCWREPDSVPLYKGIKGGAYSSPPSVKNPFYRGDYLRTQSAPFLGFRPIIEVLE